jgi:hypothetical protein
VITINPSCSVIIYVMTATNKRLLISESRGDSNRCTPCRGKPDQHNTYTREEGLPTQPTACRLTDLRVHTQLLTCNSQWSSGQKSSFCRQPTTWLTGSISPACDQYVQNMIAGATRTVLNRPRWGLQPWRCWLVTYPLPDLPIQLSPLSPNGPARSPF